MNRQVLAVLLLISGSTTAFAGEQFDIEVTDRAVVQRCVTKGLPRSIAVGMPGGFNYLFDPVRCRLAGVWFGGFLDFRPEATGRGGQPLVPLGVRRNLGTAEGPIRIGAEDRIPESVEFAGYRIEPATGIPTFCFSVDGVAVEQRVLSFGPDQVTIELAFPSPGEEPRFYCMRKAAVEQVGVSDRLEQPAAGVVMIPAAESWAQIRLRLKPTKESFVRQQPTTNGRLLYAMHCMSCHTLDGGKRIGPSFADLWTAPRIVRRNGHLESVVADEAYVRESILQPQAAIVKGYENANRMVDITQTLNEQQIEALVGFLEGLKPRSGN